DAVGDVVEGEAAVAGLVEPSGAEEDADPAEVFVGEPDAAEVAVEGGGERPGAAAVERAPHRASAGAVDGPPARLVQEEEVLVPVLVEGRALQLHPDGRPLRLCGAGEGEEGGDVQRTVHGRRALGEGSASEPSRGG